MITYTRKMFIILISALGLILTIQSLAFAQNQPPVADAGGDQALYTGEGVYLLGNATDPDGDAIAYWVWQAADVPEGADWLFTGTETRRAYFMANTPGDYLLLLIAVDSRGAMSAPDYAMIHVAENLPPVAIATADKTEGPAPLTVQFDGSQSYDPEGAPLTEYYWSFGDGTVGSFSAVPPPHTYTVPGRYSVVILAVTDEQGAVGTDTIIITVTEPVNPQLSVANASVKWSKKGALANIDVDADFDAPMFGADDTIMMTFDGITLCAVPVSAFAVDSVTGVYSWQDKQGSVSIDPSSGKISVHRSKVVMAGFDVTNGVDVRLTLGALEAVENITMAETHGDTLIYRRDDTQ